MAASNPASSFGLRDIEKMDETKEAINDVQLLVDLFLKYAEGEPPRQVSANNINAILRVLDPQRGGQELECLEEYPFVRFLMNKFHMSREYAGGDVDVFLPMAIGEFVTMDQAYDPRRIASSGRNASTERIMDNRNYRLNSRVRQRLITHLE